MDMAADEIFAHQRHHHDQCDHGKRIFYNTTKIPFIFLPLAFISFS